LIRKIIRIDGNKCNGCGLCVSACHENAIGLVNGAAKLLRDDFCDGLGVCLPVCPCGAISFEEREAAAFDESAVKASLLQQKPDPPACGCPGTFATTIVRSKSTSVTPAQVTSTPTCLKQWPVQIKLVPPVAQYFDNAHVLVAADCAAYAYGNFHAEYMKNKITVIGCPKLDGIDYSEKLTAILKMNAVKSITIARMEVPCCSGLESAVKTALSDCGKIIPWQTVIISTDGRVLKN